MIFTMNAKYMLPLRLLPLLMAVQASALNAAPAAGTNAPGGKWNWEAVPKYAEYAVFPADGANAWTLERHAAERMQLKEFINRLKRADPSEVKAFPSAADYPGIPADGTRLISRSVRVDPAVTSWQSTGLYALPGVKVTFRFPEGVELVRDGKPVYEVRIGCHSDVLWDKTASWKRVPDLSFTKQVDKREVELNNPSGGLIYVYTKGNADPQAKPFNVSVSPAAAAPVFVMGKTKPSAWEQTVKASTVPWGEIITPRMTVTLHLDQLKEIADIGKTAEVIHRGVTAQDWVAGWDKNPKEFSKRQHLVIDRQITHGGGHAGWPNCPAMGTFSWGRQFADGRILEGHWGLWHEIGHNHQRPPFVLNGMGEVTVNIFTLAAHCKALNRTLPQGWGSYGKMDDKLAAFFKSGKGFHDVNGDFMLQLYFFAEIINSFGFEPFRAASLKYIERPYDPKALTNDQKWDWLMVAFSEATRRNMAPYFEAWKFNLSPEAKKSVEKYPAWVPAPGYPGNYLAGSK